MVTPKKLECPDCGVTDYVLFDAGRLLEREFEDIYFIVTEDRPEYKAVVEAQMVDQPYLAMYDRWNSILGYKEFGF